MARSALYEHRATKPENVPTRETSSSWRSDQGPGSYNTVLSACSMCHMFQRVKIFPVGKEANTLHTRRSTHGNRVGARTSRVPLPKQSHHTKNTTIRSTHPAPEASACGGWHIAETPEKLGSGIRDGCNACRPHGLLLHIVLGIVSATNEVWLRRDPSTPRVSSFQSTHPSPSSPNPAVSYAGGCILPPWGFQGARNGW